MERHRDAILYGVVEQSFKERPLGQNPTNREGVNCMGKKHSRQGNRSAKVLRWNRVWDV